MEWGTPVWWGWFLLFSCSGGHKTKETYPTRPGSPTPCKQGLKRNLKELVRKALEMCLPVLKETNKSRFDRYSRQKQCIDHIPYYLSGLSRVHFSDNLSRNSCIHSYKNLISSSAQQNATDITRNA